MGGKPMTTMTDLLEYLAGSRSRLLASFAGLSDEQLTRKGSVGSWSIKDVLGHVAAWEWMVAGFVPEWLATGQAPDVLSVLEEHGDDAANTITVAERAAFTPGEQLEELHRARARLVACIQTLGNAALERTRPMRDWQDTLAAYFKDEVGGHEAEHTEAIAAAAKRLPFPQ
jgi:uncharacterized damage-inducible protein DinB